MAVWDWHSEFWAMASVFPDMAQHVLAWVDLSDMALQLSASPSSLRQRMSSLKDFMLSIVFTDDSVQKQRCGHSGGMDAVRTVATLTKLISAPVNCRYVICPFMADKRRRRQIWETRPGSPSNYADFPFTVKITTADRLMPPSLQYSQHFWDHKKDNFKQGRATAAAVVPSSHKKKPKTHGWVCFADRSTLQRFVQDWNGRVVDGKSLILHDMSS